MGPEIVGEIVINGFGEVKILQLSKGLQSRCGHDIYSEDVGKAVVVHIEWVRRAELSIFVRIEGACILDDVDVAGWPAGCYVADNHLLQ